MESRSLSKLQIRAEVLSILENILNAAKSIEEITTDKLDEHLNNLASIDDRDGLVELLFKELIKFDPKKARVISFFLMKLGKLEKLRTDLWNCIKNPGYEDEMKECANAILLGLGEEVKPDVFLGYLKNPTAIIDKETKNLLEIAYVNPEAQVDFLDFLFSLSVNEQVNLVKSLKFDYPGEYLAAILSPALESNPEDGLKELLIEILAESKSIFAVPALNEIAKYSENVKLKKSAQKSLKLLKISGVNIDNANEILKNVEVCTKSKIYKCYTSLIDGVGSQGLIISRITDKNKIILFSVVINDLRGIVDCFGFYKISVQDLEKIVERFEQNSTRVEVSEEYCKLKLEEAARINRQENLPLSYEYCCWKSLLFDIDPMKESIESVAKSWGDESLIPDGKYLHKITDFFSWFLQEKDHEALELSVKNILKNIEKNFELYENDESALLSWMDIEINKLISAIFDKEVVETYIKRLLNVAYLLDLQNIIPFRDLASSVALEFSQKEKYPLENSTFLIDLMKKSIYQGILKNQFDKNQTSEFKTKNLRKISDSIDEKKDSMDTIIEILFKHWFNS